MRPPPRRVHQVLATLSHGDAIGNEALAIQRHLRAAGFESDLFAETTHPRMSQTSEKWGGQKCGSAAVTLAHVFCVHQSEPIARFPQGEADLWIAL